MYLFSYVYIRRLWLKIDSCIKRYALQIVHVKNLTRGKSNALSILHVIKATRMKSYTYENIHVWNGEFWLVLKHTRMKSFTKLLIRVSFYTRNFWYAYRFIHETFDTRMFSNVKLFIRGTFGTFCPLWPTIVYLKERCCRYGQLHPKYIVEAQVFIESRIEAPVQAWNYGWPKWTKSAKGSTYEKFHVKKHTRIKRFVYITIRVSKVSCIKWYAYQKFRV